MPVIGIYRPIAGWKACLYGPQGPEETSFQAWATPEEAYTYALEWGKAIGVEVTRHQSFGTCDKHGKNVVDGTCDVCVSNAFTARLNELANRRHKQ